MVMIVTMALAANLRRQPYDLVGMLSSPSTADDAWRRQATRETGHRDELPLTVCAVSAYRAYPTAGRTPIAASRWQFLVSRGKHDAARRATGAARSGHATMVGGFALRIRPASLTSAGHHRRRDRAALRNRPVAVVGEYRSALRQRMSLPAATSPPGAQ